MTKKPLGLEWAKKVSKTSKAGVFLHKARKGRPVRKVIVEMKGA